MINVGNTVIVHDPSALDAHISWVAATHALFLEERAQILCDREHASFLTIACAFNDSDAHGFQPSDLDDMISFILTPMNEPDQAGFVHKICVKLGIQNIFSAQYRDHFKKFCRICLYGLWANGNIILPNRLNKSWQLSNSDIEPYLNEIGRFCIYFNGDESEYISTAKSKYGRDLLSNSKKRRSLVHRIRYNVHRWLPSTSWQNFSDISEKDCFDIRSIESGFLDVGKNCFKDVMIFLHTLVGRDGHDEILSTDYVYRLALYFSDPFFKARSFEEVETAFDERAKRRRQRIATADKNRLKLPRIKQARSAPDTLSIGEYANIPRIGWFRDMNYYQWLRVRMSEESQRCWAMLFDKYAEYRKIILGLESGAETGPLRVLSDYLTGFIPMYLDNSLDINCTSADIKELSSNIPASPKYMNRSKFIANMDDRGSLFPTLLQFISGRQNSVSSDKAVILGINKFFEFIEINYADDSYSDIAGGSFRNPINISFDSPRDVGRRSQKTTKKIIPQKTGSAIKNWLYCAEALVSFMDEKRLYRKFMGLKGKVNKIIDSEEFGFVPFYYDGKKCIAVKSFPFDILTPLHKENRISASILRMIILSFETGLRLQSSQWLCRRNFSRYFGSNSGLIFPLYVNTDKVNDGFVVPVIHRVADMLKRESEFQASLEVDDVDVTYEGRAFTRFEHLLPLFRNPETRLPFNDSS